MEAEANPEANIPEGEALPSEQLNCNNIGLDPKNRQAYYQLLSMAAWESVGAPDGAVFQILHLARYLAVYRAAPGSALKVKWVEAGRMVPFYNQEDEEPQIEFTNDQAVFLLEKTASSKFVFMRHRVVDF